MGILVKRSLGQKSNFALAFELDGNAYFFNLMHLVWSTYWYINVEREKDGGKGRDKVTTIDYFITFALLIIVSKLLHLGIDKCIG